MPLWAIKALLVLGLAASLSALVWGGYRYAYRQGEQAANARWAAQIDAERADRAEAVLAAEREAQRAQAAIVARYEQELADAKGQSDRVAADLRAGNLRLRREWQGCQAERVPAAADSAARSDDAAELREAGAGNLVRLAAECDARIRGLQGVIRQWTSSPSFSSGG